MSDAKPVMGQFFSRDMDEAYGRLAPWFQARIDAPDVKLDALYPARAPGLSHELINADISWQGKTGRVEEALILRLDPVRYRKRRTSNLRREFEVQRIMRGLGQAPVAPVRWYEADASLLGAEFYVMERLEGRTPRDEPPWQLEGWVVDLSLADRNRLWRNAVSTLAKIHRSPIEAFRSIRIEQTDEPDFLQQLRHWRASYEWATAQNPNPVAEEGWRWLFANIPDDPPQGLVWGDAHPRNMMFQGLEVHAVLDWEDTSMGSPLSDLARWRITDRLQAVWGRPAPQGLPSHEEMVAQWEAETSYSAHHLRWFEVLNGCFAASTLARSAQLQAETLGKVVGVDAAGASAVNAIIQDLIGNVP